MIAIPWFIVEILKIYPYTDISYGLDHFGRRADAYGLIIAVAFCLVTIGLYWLLCVPLSIDLKSTLTDAPVPDNIYLKILVIVYFIIVKPYIEEWFWRRYNYDIFPYYELEFWLVSFFWGLTYAAVAYNISSDIIATVIVGLIFLALGRFLIWMRWEHGVFANYITHMGICGGIVV